MLRRCLCVCFGCVMVAVATAAERPVRFNRDIRPILTDKCFACHGPDAETVEGDLRLDLPDSAKGEDGAIVPSDPEASELVRRIFSADEYEVMPPPEAHKPLTQAERDVLRRWIAEGAEYESHWAYTTLKRPDIPQGPGANWAINAIDDFIAARLELENVEPTAEADRITLIRRLSFDLTGIPPTPAEVDAFVKDTADNAYDKLVDRLLNSPRYGERMAMYWLDLVRYADTVGYHGDQDVSQWPYRDYVINAFNDNVPYDQFIREQLAGDLLPEATLSQLVASGYNRLNQTTEEGGAQPKEYLAIYFADRVRNFSQVFMGATMGCAQCHDHKFDPYTMRDFYSLGAFFADLDERGKYDARQRPPEIRVPSPELQERLAEVEQRISDQCTRTEVLRDEVLASQAAWEVSVRGEIERQPPIESSWIDDEQKTGGNNSGAWEFVSREQGPVHSGSHSRRQSADGLVQHFFDDAQETITVSDQTRFFAWVNLDPQNPPTAIMLQFNDGTWEHRAVWGSDDIRFGRKPESWDGYRRQGPLPEAGEWVRLEVNPQKVGLKPETIVKGMAFTQFGGLAHWDQAGWTDAAIPVNVARALAIAPRQRTGVQSKLVADFYLANAETLVKAKEELSNLEAERISLEESAPTSVVSRSVDPRTIRILARGNWMDDSGEIVQPAIPAYFGDLGITQRRATRLDLANWLCEPDNPLTSRVMVNRLWALLFGRGICTSVDDLGGQGTYPSYPDLLDWLAVEFVESGWDIKHVIRTIVTSATYRRTSKPTSQLLTADPYNDLFARQGRFRIEAEMVRDAALFTSGLLVEKVGGQSVKPYQPAGYYDQLNFPRRTYVADTGDEQYRRGVYTHWQRTFLHPMLKAFDAPSREECTAARSRSNTPLQALTLLNDPTFVEAARVFAQRFVHAGGTTPDEKIDWAYRIAVSRAPESAVATELRQLYERHLEHYQEHLNDAEQLISEGAAPTAVDIDPAQLAAWTSVARAILNLSETITRN